MSAVRVYRYDDPATVARQAARRLSARLVELQRDGRVAQLCLTGGRIATAMYGQLGPVAVEDGVDSSRLELWWGDERFVPTGDPERNAGPALAALAGTMTVDAARTHPMPAAGGNADLDTSAATYAKELGDTVFDICLLGMGPDGHAASLFPDHPSFDPGTTLNVVGVRNAPKPPPNRISLTLPTINRSREVWFLVTGEDKADAVRRVFEGDVTLPATGVKGADRLLWFVDEAAAQHLPRYQCTL